MRLILRLAGGTVLGGALLLGCGSGDVTHVHLNATCRDTMPLPAAVLDVSTLTSCIYHPDLRRLDLEIGNATGDYYKVQVIAFTGTGTYTTTASSSDLDTFVETHGTASNGLGATSAEAPLCPTNPMRCQINVSTAAVVTAGVGGTGRVALDVSCPRLFAYGVNCPTCDLSPGSVHIDIAACGRSD